MNSTSATPLEKNVILVEGIASTPHPESARPETTSMTRVTPFLVFVLAPLGCRNEASKADSERVVREVIAAQFRIAPHDIDLNQRLSAPPFKADDLDVVELIMSIEERIHVEIPDSVIEKHAGGKQGETANLTPRQLIRIIEECKARSARK